MADATGEDMVQPAPGVEQAPEVTPNEPAPQEPQGGSLPDNVLKIPAMQALMAGNPAALSANIKDFNKKPEAKILAENKQGLTEHGFDFYKSQSGDLGVIFNTLHIHPQDLQAADAAGKLREIAPPFDVVNHAVTKSGLHNPVLTAQTPPKGQAMAGPPQPPQAAQAPMQAQPAVAPAGSAILKNLMNARVKNMQPGSPLSGPEPGAGRLLNAILKPVT